ncbi:uncharacterized protein LOC100899428 [Galendromus occidentalis]|uniref:Uncharacterized protein LOC100899428 n=1 Tax=Galendromus occidentalis TaxID=34638 RepID=A0AAJ6QV60_9ACAR|nr:uncharacterized protein LOC100899428 [Galendromus occidentalis]
MCSRGEHLAMMKRANESKSNNSTSRIGAEDFARNLMPPLPKNPRSLHSILGSSESDAEESGSRIQKRLPYKSIFRSEYKAKIVENFSMALEDNRLHEALGFFESRKRIPPVKYVKSSVLINARLDEGLGEIEFEAFGTKLEDTLNTLRRGDPVQIFFIHRHSAKQLIFVRAVERDDPLCRLHKMHLAAQGPLFPLNTNFDGVTGA